MSINLKYLFPSIALFLLSCLNLSSQQDTFLVSPYLQYATQTGISILWETHDLSEGSVFYTEARQGSSEVEFEQEIQVSDAKTLHEVRIENLKKNTKYLYQIEAKLNNGEFLKSSISTFKTNVNQNDAFFFAFLGDSQMNSKTPQTWSRIAQRVYDERPNFIIHAGDLVDKGSVKTDWTKHFFPGGQVAMSRYAMYTVLGNHEQDAQNYYDYMANPLPEYYYTFHYGNAQFFMLDSNKDLSEGSEQYNWLEWELARSTSRWKFVVHHHPPYSSDNNDFGDAFIGISSKGKENRNLLPLLEKYKVDFCLYGHTHLYERTWPIFNEAINQKEGVIYINSGGAGGSIENFGPTRSWFTVEQQAVHHYCTFSIFDNTVIFKAIDVEGKLFDSFEIKKEEEERSRVLVPPGPKIKYNRSVFEDTIHVELQAFSSDLSLRYTKDGSQPTKDSELYSKSIVVDESCQLKVASFTSSGIASRTVQEEFIKKKALAAREVEDLVNGLEYEYFEGVFEKLPDFDKLSPKSKGIVNLPNLKNIQTREDHFAIRYTGFIKVPSKASYKFYTYSDDGSQLLIDDELVVDSDGDHSAQYISGTTILEAGMHEIEIRYFEASGGSLLNCGFIKESQNKASFTPWQLFYVK